MASALELRRTVLARFATAGSALAVLAAHAHATPQGRTSGGAEAGGGGGGGGGGEDRPGLQPDDDAAGSRWAAAAVDASALSVALTEFAASARALSDLNVKAEEGDAGKCGEIGESSAPVLVPCLDAQGQPLSAAVARQKVDRAAGFVCDMAPGLQQSLETARESSADEEIAASLRLTLSQLGKLVRFLVESTELLDSAAERECESPADIAGTRPDFFDRGARLATFKPRQTETGIVEWPHASPSAEAMADAGFVFEPKPGVSDRVKCFHCNVILLDWKLDDEPLNDHRDAEPSCSFAASVHPVPSASSVPSAAAALLAAIAADDAGTVERLVAEGVAVSQQSRGGEGDTPVHAAIRLNHKSCLLALLKAETLDLDAVTTNGDTALHLAARLGAADCVKLLLSLPAVKTDAKNNAGELPSDLTEDAAILRLLRILVTRRVAKQPMHPATARESAPLTTREKEIAEAAATSAVLKEETTSEKPARSKSKSDEAPAKADEAPANANKRTTDANEELAKADGGPADSNKAPVEIPAKAHGDPTIGHQAPVKAHQQPLKHADNPAEQSIRANAEPEKVDPTTAASAPPECSRCGQSFVKGEERLQTKGKFWHSQCFRCAVCEKPFEHKFVVKGSSAFHADCKEKFRSSEDLVSGSKLPPVKPSSSTEPEEKPRAAAAAATASAVDQAATVRKSSTQQLRRSLPNDSHSTAPEHSPLPPVGCSFHDFLVACVQ